MNARTPVENATTFSLNPTLLTPESSLLLLVDYQQHVLDEIGSGDHELIELNGRALARAARAFGVPVIVTTIGVKLRGDAPTLPSIRGEVPEAPEFDRNTMNAWEDEAFVRAVRDSGRRRLIFAGLTTEVCLEMPVVHAQHEGWETYFIADAVGAFTVTSHEMATRRMQQAGSRPLTVAALYTEWLRDWGASPHAKKALEFFGWYQPEVRKVRERLRAAPYRADLM